MFGKDLHASLFFKKSIASSAVLPWHVIMPLLGTTMQAMGAKTRRSAKHCLQKCFFRVISLPPRYVISEAHTCTTLDWSIISLTLNLQRAFSVQNLRQAQTMRKIWLSRFPSRPCAKVIFYRVFSVKTRKTVKCIVFQVKAENGEIVKW